MTYTPGDKQSFIEALMPYAMQQSARTGVDPRIIIAQAAQETGWGKHVPGGNLFGIKSHGKAGGKTFATKEVYGGKTVSENASFRQYGSVGDSVAGYGDFLLENPRYAKMRAADGLEAQAAALQASGYATDPNYGATVLSIARGIPYAGSSSDYARGAVSGSYGGKSNEAMPQKPLPDYAIGALGGGYNNPKAQGSTKDEPLSKWDRFIAAGQKAFPAQQEQQQAQIQAPPIPKGPTYRPQEDSVTRAWRMLQEMRAGRRV